MLLKGILHIARPAAWLCLLGLLPLAAGCVSLGGSQRAVFRAKDRVAPALVHIRPVKEVFARGKREEVLAVGSGFVISPDGYVVTNEHVAGEKSRVRCILSTKEEVAAEVVGVDPYTDIAVLKLNVDGPLPHVAWGDSEDLEAGQMVLAMGSPHGLARSVSLGIVSVTDRYLPDRGPSVAPYNNWIQTDAAINPGNSGGPLVNLRGQVVGVNARMLRGAENVGFAIPVNTAREVAQALIETGRMRRSWVGLALQEMLAKTEDPAVRGVVIADVDPLSPGYEAGLRAGDVLVAINGEAADARFAEDLPAVRKRIASLPVGEATVFRVLRGAENLDLEVVTEPKSALRGDEVEFSEWGLTAYELTSAMVRRAQLPRRQGVLVSGRQVGGAAANAGLSAGDIILEIDNEAIENLAHFKRLYDQRIAAGTEAVMLFVKHGALTRFVLVNQNAAPETEDEWKP